MICGVFGQNDMKELITVRWDVRLQGSEDITNRESGILSRLDSGYNDIQLKRIRNIWAK